MHKCSFLPACDRIAFALRRDSAVGLWDLVIDKAKGRRHGGHLE
jgi:hypothetical protein